MARKTMTEHERRQKALDAEQRGNSWLAVANQYREMGNTARANVAYSKGQYWLDRFNRLTGRT